MDRSVHLLHPDLSATVTSCGFTINPPVAGQSLHCRLYTTLIISYKWICTWIYVCIYIYIYISYVYHHSCLVCGFNAPLENTFSMLVTGDHHPISEVDSIQLLTFLASIRSRSNIHQPCFKHDLHHPLIYIYIYIYIIIYICIYVPYCDYLEGTP